MLLSAVVAVQLALTAHNRFARAATQSCQKLLADQLSCVHVLIADWSRHNSCRLYSLCSVQCVTQHWQAAVAVFERCSIDVKRYTSAVLTYNGSAQLERLVAERNTAETGMHHCLLCELPVSLSHHNP
eukprot:6754-Heterococcus_DN1.PRE.4